MKKILIADDEPHVSLVLKQFFERAGLRVFSTLNGALAVDLIKQERPDAIIADIQMPIMDGIELCDFVQQNLPGYQPLLVLMASKTDRDIEARLESHKHLLIMKKPLSMSRLLARINDYCGSAQN